MAPDTSADPATSGLDPNTVGRRDFATARRGYEQLEVRGFLGEVAGELRALQERVRGLERSLRKAEERTVPVDDIDPHQLTLLVGEETARVLEAARVAAEEIRAKAEGSVAQLLRDAQDDANRMRAEAEGVLAVRTEEAEGEATTIRAAAEDLRAGADAARQAEVDVGRAAGQALLAEAEAERDRVLGELNRRRRQANRQLEQLGAARERLLEAYDVVRRTADEATTELEVSLAEAREAARAAAGHHPAEGRHQADDDSGEVALGPSEGGASSVRSVSAVAAPADHTESMGRAQPIEEPQPTEEAQVADEKAPAASAAVAPVDGAGQERRLGARRRFRQRDEARERPASNLPPVEASAAFEAVRPVSAAPAPPPASVPDEGAPEEEPVAAEAPTVEGHDAQHEEAQHEAAAEPAPPEATEAVEARDEVDDLFARIRSSRADAVAHAHEVLDDDDEVEAVVADVAPPSTNGTVDAAALTVVAGDEDVDEDARVAAPAVADETRARALSRRDEVTAELELGLARRLKRVLSDEQSAALDLLRRESGPFGIDQVLGQRADHAGPYRAAAADDLAEAARSGAAFVDAAGGGGATVVDDLAAQLAEELVTLLRDRLDRCFADAADDDELADRVRACYREWKTQRIAQTARHFVLAAFSRGLFDAVPAGTPVCWVVDDGGVPCPDAEDNSLAGLVAKCDAFPTGHPYPPAHPGCRCLVVPGGG
ncbi:hypothetical protein BH20ACT2_BH20ACT2_10420 [soil metagenome]